MYSYSIYVLHISMFTIVYEKNDQWYYAYIADVDDINWQWDMKNAARENVKEAYALVMQYRKEEALKKKGISIETFSFA